MVYVLDVNGRPLMPTDRHGKVRRLLKEGKAKVISRCPFTIQLLYNSKGYTQNISLGVDAGSKHIGLSATTKDKELYASDVELRNDVVKLLSTRKQQNRVRSKHKGWLAPSVEQKIQSHLKAIIHKATIYKGGRKKLNQAPYIVNGFRLFDKVLYQGEEYFIFGRRKSGYFDIRNLQGQKVNKGSVSCKRLKLLETRKSYLIERRKQDLNVVSIPPATLEVGVSC